MPGSATRWRDTPLVVALARAAGGTVVSLRVDGGVDSILAVRIDTLFDLL